MAVRTTDLTGGLLAVIVVSEEDGISPELLRLVDNHVKIPLLGAMRQRIGRKEPVRCGL